MCDKRLDPAGLGAVQRRILGDLTGTASSQPERRDRLFCLPPCGSVADRWQIYQNGYFLRIHDALSQEFSAVQRVLGDEAFAALTTRYLAVHPPRHFDLAQVGERLPLFLQHDRLAVDLPFLPDLAQLERNVAESFVAADLPELDWSSAYSLGAQRLAQLALKLHPATRVIQSDWPLLDLWLTREERDDAIDIDLALKPRTFVVHRQEEKIYCKELLPIESELIGLLAEHPRSLSRAADLMGASTDADRVRELVVIVRRLVGLGLFEDTLRAT